MATTAVEGLIALASVHLAASFLLRFVTVGKLEPVRERREVLVSGIP